MGEEKLVLLLQESLAAATRTGAAKPADFTRVIVDTTVQPKAVAFPTDAKLLARARQHLVRLAQQQGVALRQSYARVGKIALLRHQRYAHAKQFKRANRALKTLRTQLGRVSRDIRRKIKDNAELWGSVCAEARTGRTDPWAAPETAWTKSLQPACPRGGMHRQRQAAPAL